MTIHRLFRPLLLAAAAVLTPLAAARAEEGATFDPVAEALEHIGAMDVGPYDWPQWGGTPARNNTPHGENIPDDWDIQSGKNIKWTAKLGSQTYGNPTVANGKVYVGTNNAAGYISRYPWNDQVQIDLGVFLCFEEETGKFLWQHSSTKLPTGRVHDWPMQGICCAPYVDGKRLWFVTSRGEVVCLDTEGFYDGKNDGPYTAEESDDLHEADVIWKFDMMGELGVSQHNMCSCSITGIGDVIFVATSNGVDETHVNIPAPQAPSFMAMNRDTGEVLWTDNSPGNNILHGQWSSPTYGVMGGQPQVLFAGGDGWLYSFDPAGDGEGNAKLLWKFDCNPKDSRYILGGQGTRNEIIATPVIYDGLVYVAVGQDPEHGEGPGHLWCIDPTRRGDVSPTLAFDAEGNPLPVRRLQAINPNDGEREEPNPNSAVVWHYDKVDQDGDGKFSFEETMHRSCGTVAIKDDILYISDFSGLVHCLNAKEADENKKPTVYWTHDMFAQSWGSPLIVDGKVYFGDEDGDITIFEHSKEKTILNEINMGNAVFTTPIVANNVLYIANRTTLFAIAYDDE